MRWKFRIDGEEFDLKAIFKLFEQGTHLTHEAEKYYLALDLPHGPDDAQGALYAAQQLLARLNGIAHVRYDNHHSVKISEVFHIEPETGKVTFVGLPARAQLRIRGGTPSGSFTNPDSTVNEIPVR